MPASHQRSPALELTVGAGRRCALSQPDVPGLHDYYVLSVLDRSVPLSTAELDELGALAQRLGRMLALERLGDAECYSLIYNAGRTRRKPWPHFHIVLSASTPAKRRAFFLLQLKHLLRLFGRSRLLLGRFA